MSPETYDHDAYQENDPNEWKREFLDQARAQTKLLNDIKTEVELDACLIEKIGHIICQNANEAHRQTQLQTSILKTLETLLEMYKGVHPEQALQLERLAKIQAELNACCPPDEKVDEICHFEPCERGGRFTRGEGYSMKSRGFIEPVPFDQEDHEPWEIVAGTLNEDERLPLVAQGAIVGQLIPSAPTPQVLNFMDGTVPSGSQAPVTFRTFSNSGISTSIWPPDMSGAKAGDVVLMSGNLWLKLSVDGGKNFTDLDFTKVFAAEKTYGGWAGDQVIHYVPAIDCFVLYVQSKHNGTNPNKNVVKVAFASPTDLKKYSGGKAAWWRQWDFTSDDFGLGDRWMDFPDLSYGDKFLYVFTNTFTGKDFQGKLFFELPLAEIQAGKGFSFQYALVADTSLVIGSPTQNIAGENYWAAHVDNANMRVYSSKGGDPNYYWRDRKLNANWPRAAKDDNVVSAAPDSTDWISEDHRIIGATRVNNQLWFAWTAASGDGGGGGFKFPQAHIQIAKFDVSQDYKLIEQTQIWNADHAFAYPSLTTNSDNEVGISLAWGGGKYYGSHAVGILGDFVVWYGEASDKTSAKTSPTRWGDYVHVRLAHPDTRFFSAFGYAVLNDASLAPPEKGDYSYVEFGREKLNFNSDRLR
ncbi:MAG: hypothetical protein GC179_11715 [Anaerolineaceae bacterium]|nr:hypothetical protein [Anaerolineaceae bacterium]